MTTPIRTTGHAREGELYLRNARKVAAAVARWGELDITIAKKRRMRTHAQLAYYWPVVIERVRAVWQKAQQRIYTPEEVHELLKAQFMDPELILTGRIRGALVNGLAIGTTTRDLNTLEFIEFTERIVQWAAEKWDCYIPDPDPDWKIHALEEARLEDNAA